MAWVKLSGGWINLDHVGAVDDEHADGISLHSELRRAKERISVMLSGEDAQTVRGALNALSANVATAADIAGEAEQDAATEAIMDRS